VWINTDIAETSEYTGVAMSERSSARRYTPGDLLEVISMLHLQAAAECGLSECGDGVEDDEDAGKHFCWTPGREGAVVSALAAEEKTWNQKEVQAYSMCTPRKDGTKAYPICTQRIPTQSTCDELPNMAEGTEEDDSDVESIDDDEEDDDDWLQGFPEWMQGFPERGEESTTHREHDDDMAATQHFEDKTDSLQTDWSGDVSSLPVSARRLIFEPNQQRCIQRPACQRQSLQNATYEGKAHNDGSNSSA
jgi:hypothetical protein